MDLIADGADREPAAVRSVTATYHSEAEVAPARDLARGFLRHLVVEDGLTVSGPDTDIVSLVVTELVTNARKYAHGPHTLTLQITGRLLAVTVQDTNTELPTTLPVDPARAGGHGLEIVRAVSKDLTARREPEGKTVTARIELARPPPPSAIRRPPTPTPPATEAPETAAHTDDAACPPRTENCEIPALVPRQAAFDAPQDPT
ncbi:ATP-binding protein [Streptomyces sp. IBSNAI002]|uniref:ATP-binding protein n=1 Tax=Streptomyces sp. IBSNAI002 TaxID=3457500 RepID=UPI003FCF1782